MNRTEKLVKNISLFTIGNLGSKVITFILVPIYTYVLTAKEYGEADLIVTTVSMVIPLLTLSLSDGVLRFAMEKDCKKSALLKIIYCVIFSSTFVALFFSPCLKLIGIDSKYNIFFIILYFLSSWECCIANYIKGIGKTTTFAVKGILFTFCFVICNIILLVVCKLGVMGYFISYIVANSVAILYMYLSANIRVYVKEEFDKNLFKDILKYSIPLIPASVAWWITNYSDKYMISYELGLEANGIYSIAYKIPSAFVSVMSIFTQAWQISAIDSMKDKDYAKFISRIFDMFYLVCFGICMILVLGAESITKFMYSEEYHSSWECTILLGIASVASVLCSFLNGIFMAYKKSKSMSISTISAAVVNILLNFILIRSCGLIGAAYATLISYIIMLIIRMYCLKKIIDLNFSYSRLWVGLIILIILGMCNIYMDNLLVKGILLLCFVAINIKHLVKLVKINVR